MIPRYTHPEMGRIWSEQRRYETWLQVEIAAAEAMADAGIVPAEAARELRDKGAFDIARIDEIEKTTQHDVIAFTTVGGRDRRAVGPLAALRPDLLRRRRHRAGAADGRGLRPDPQEHDGARRGDQDARRRAQAHADDRPHARRARRGDDVRPQAGAVVRRAGCATSSASAARARRVRVGKISGAVGTFAHLDPSIEADGLPAARPRAGADLVAGHPARSPRRADDARWRSPPRRSRSSRSRSAACRRPRSARSKSRSARARRARRRCRTSATRSAASRSSGWRG